jgi:hypothetical protein
MSSQSSVRSKRDLLRFLLKPREWLVSKHLDLTLPLLGVSLRVQWQGPHCRVYDIDYPPAGGAATAKESNHIDNETEYQELTPVSPVNRESFAPSSQKLSSAAPHLSSTMKASVLHRPLDGQPLLP